MSGLEGDQFRWRDTYFVWFSSKRRPALKQIEATLRALPERFELEHPEEDEAGGFESLTLLSAGDHAALEISYLEGDDLREQAQSLAEEIKEGGEAPRERLARLASCDARFDIMQFEQVEDDEEDEDMFDPSTLLIVLGALSKLVDGIGVDPQSGLLV
jgi:hypothetical protein